MVRNRKRRIKVKFLAFIAIYHNDDIIYLPVNTLLHPFHFFEISCYEQSTQFPCSVSQRSICFCIFKKIQRGIAAAMSKRNRSSSSGFQFTLVPESWHRTFSNTVPLQYWAFRITRIFQARQETILKPV